MNIKEIIKKDLHGKFEGICVVEGNIPIEELKKTLVLMAYLFNKDRVSSYIGKQVLVAGSGDDRGKYFTAQIENVLSVRELWNTHKYQAGINLHESIVGKWISDNIGKPKQETTFLDKRKAIIFTNATEVKEFNTDWVSFSRPSFYYIHASEQEAHTEKDLFQIKKLSISNFLNFSDINEEFATGINVIIGENNVGKTGLIKFLYANAKSTEEYISLKNTPRERSFRELLSHKLQKTFQSSERIGTIVSKSSDEELKSILTFYYGEEKDTKEIKFSFDKKTYTEISNLSTFEIKKHENIPEFNTIFIPAKEILSISDAIKVAIKEYEVEFDATYEDLLSDIEPPFKKEEDYDDIALKEIISNVQNEILNGEIVYDKNYRKYYYKDYSGNKFDLTMTAEGIKQLGIIPTLIKTGKITQGTILFLDEPDNNLNPAAIKTLVEILIKLANVGVQIFFTTHNHLLSQLVSLYGEYRDVQDIQIPDMKFFALYKNQTGKTELETSNELIDITNNSILDEFVNMHDKEEELNVKFLQQRKSLNF